MIAILLHHPYLGAGGRFDVPVPHSGIIHVWVLVMHQPLHGGILTQEPGAGAKVLPGQTGVPLVVILEYLVQLPAPVNAVDDLGFTIKDVGWDVDRAVGGVDRDTGEVFVGSEDHAGVPNPVVIIVLVTILREVARILVTAALVILVKNIELLGVVVREATSLEPVTHVLVILVVQGNVLGQLHDPLDGVNLVLHHDLHLSSHPLHHLEAVNLLHAKLSVTVVALVKGSLVSLQITINITWLEKFCLFSQSLTIFQDTTSIVEANFRIIEMIKTSASL